MFHLIVCLLASLAHADIIGVPSITCEPDGIHARVNMSGMFVGKIYLRGHYGKEGCMEDYSQHGTEMAEPTFSFDACHMRRKRQADPSGLLMTSVMVVSHHPTLVTYKDVAFEIHCFYREHDSNTVTMDMEVKSADSNQTLISEPPMPVCEYYMEMNSQNEKLPSSPAVARVGDSVTHIWKCGDKGEPNQVYCMQVHSCLADDGQNYTVPVVDANGCSIDKDLLSSISYEDSMKATAFSRVFKFADRSEIRFQCQIRLSLRRLQENGTCPLPYCSHDVRSKRSVPIGRTIDVDSEYMTVLENGRVEFLAPGPPSSPSCSLLSWPLLAALSVFLVYFILTVCYIFHSRPSQPIAAAYYW